MNQSVVFSDVYQLYAPRVLKMCMAYTDDSAQAQDLLQETFIKVWQSLPGFRGEAKISTWIYRIAVNTCLTHIRSGKKLILHALPDGLEIIDENGAVEKEQHLQQLYQAIHQLPETDRLIISMVLEELPYAEIAETMNIKEGNLRVKIHRIKQQLTTLFFSDEQI